MIEKQTTEVITIEELFARCAALRFEGWRLVQIGCTALPGGAELNYTFDKSYEFLNLRVRCNQGDAIPTIQTVYECAFIYENEIAELFAINITDMPVDFKGQFYKTAQFAPFACRTPEPEEKN